MVTLIMEIIRLQSLIRQTQHNPHFVFLGQKLVVGFVYRAMDGLRVRLAVRLMARPSEHLHYFVIGARIGWYWGSFFSSPLCR